MAVRGSVRARDKGFAPRALLYADLLASAAEFSAFITRGKKLTKLVDQDAQDIRLAEHASLAVRGMVQDYRKHALTADMHRRRLAELSSSGPDDPARQIAGRLLTRSVQAMENAHAALRDQIETELDEASTTALGTNPLRPPRHTAKHSLWSNVIGIVCLLLGAGLGVWTVIYCHNHFMGRSERYIGYGVQGIGVITFVVSLFGVFDIVRGIRRHRAATRASES